MKRVDFQTRTPSLIHLRGISGGWTLFLFILFVVVIVLNKLGSFLLENLWWTNLLMFWFWRIVAEGAMKNKSVILTKFLIKNISSVFNWIHERISRAMETAKTIKLAIPDFFTDVNLVSFETKVLVKKLLLSVWVSDFEVRYFFHTNEIWSGTRDMRLNAYRAIVIIWLVWPTKKIRI